jgi:hypothetical protein
MSSKRGYKPNLDPAAQVLSIAGPLVKGVPIVGSIVESAITTVLEIIKLVDVSLHAYISHVADHKVTLYQAAKLSRDECADLAARAAAITAAVVKEVMNADPARLRMLEASTANLLWYLFKCYPSGPMVAHFPFA